MFFPGKIENIIIIIETQHITVTGPMLEVNIFNMYFRTLGL